MYLVFVPTNRTQVTKMSRLLFVLGTVVQANGKLNKDRLQFLKKKELPWQFRPLSNSDSPLVVRLGIDLYLPVAFAKL